MMKTINSNGAVLAPLGVYVHIPFCIRKCKYCDFVSYADKNKEQQLVYVEKLIEEIQEKAKLHRDRFIVDTVFFGGGTPSILPAEELIKLLNCIIQNFNCELSEISFEANPGTVNKEKFSLLKSAGFNRVSIGVQSFDDRILSCLGRIHNASEAEAAVLLAKEMGFNTNIDLMFGVPGQNLDIWKDSLERAIELNPQHISFYSLQLEEGTALYNEYRFGTLNLPSWDENRKMYHLAIDYLKANGYKHYEISNAAKPGFECRHNLKYWSMKEYLGFGESAHSYIDGLRTGEAFGDPKGDFIFTRLRLIDGFEKSEYLDMFGISFDDEFKEIYKELLREDLLEEHQGKIRFTKKGLDFTNPVMAKLINAID